MRRAGLGTAVSGRCRIVPRQSTGDFPAAPHIEAIPAMTPFIGPEQLMRERGFQTLLRLGANESAFGPSPRAVAAMAAELPHLAWYGDPESHDLREAIAHRHGCAVENVSVGSGIDDLMGLAVRAFMAPGATALTTQGTYPTFSYHVRGFGGTVETVPYRTDGRVDIDALIERARDCRPAMVYLANPDNPSGTAVPLDDIERLFESLPAQSLLLLDEAYADFVENDEGFAFFDGRLVRMRTFSKAYGMAGARIGFALTSSRNVQTFQKIRLHYGVNRNAQIGALAALEDDAFRRFIVAEVDAGRQEYYEIARDIGTSCIPSCTNFVCIDFTTNERAGSVMQALLEHGVFVRKPTAAPLDRFVRVSVGTRAERVEFAVRLRQVLERLAA